MPHQDNLELARNSDHIWLNLAKVRTIFTMREKNQRTKLVFTQHLDWEPQKFIKMTVKRVTSWEQVWVKCRLQFWTNKLKIS